MNKKSKEEVIEAIQLAARSCDNGILLQNQFYRNSNVTKSDVLRNFPKWSDACQAAGAMHDTAHEPKSDEVILNDWGKVTRKFGHIPTMSEYHHNGIHGRNAFNRFGKWSDIQDAFRKFYGDSDEWRDVINILELEKRRTKKRISPGPKVNNRDGGKHSYIKLVNKTIYGDPIDFRGLRHEPVNEQGVVFLFGMVARDLNYIVEAIQVGFPDCEAKRKISRSHWQPVQIEFEYESKTFVDHGHNPQKCDVIVCWIDNWAERPENLEVLVLSEVIKKLQSHISKDGIY